MSAFAVKMPQQCGPLSVETRYIPAHGAALGGDLYDVLPTPFGVRAIIADVTGHGPSAAGLAHEVRQAFCDLARHEPHLTGLAHRLDSLVAAQVGGSCERFVSAALIEINDGCADLLVCGHPLPLLVHKGEARQVTVPTVSLPLGLHTFGGEGACAPTTFGFAQGDALLLFTDGAIEARNGHGEPYPFETRAARFWRVDPAGMLSRLEQELTAYRGGSLEDDVALLLIRHQPAP